MLGRLIVVMATRRGVTLPLSLCATLLCYNWKFAQSESKLRRENTIARVL